MLVVLANFLFLTKILYVKFNFTPSQIQFCDDIIDQVIYGLFSQKKRTLAPRRYLYSRF